MPIQVGQRVKDHTTGRSGQVIKRLPHYDQSVTIVVNPSGDHEVFLVDEWRLDVIGNPFVRVFEVCREFLRSDTGSALYVRVAFLAPYLCGVVTGAGVLLFRCHCN